jgi:excisionase family DNA binding protein
MPFRALVLPPDDGQGLKCSPAYRNSDLVAIRPLAVTVEQAAQMLGVGRATLYRLIMRGEIQSFTVGRARRIAVSVLEAYVARGCSV